MVMLATKPPLKSQCPPPPIGPPNRIVRDGSVLVRYDWKSEAQRDEWPVLVERERASIERHTWGGRWRRLVKFFAGLSLTLTMGCAGAFYVTQVPVPDTAKVVTLEDGTPVMVVANKTTCLLIWTIAEGSTPCGSSAQWAAEAFQFIGGALDFGKRFLPAGLFPKPEVEESE